MIREIAQSNKNTSCKHEVDNTPSFWGFMRFSRWRRALSKLRLEPGGGQEEGSLLQAGSQVLGRPVGGRSVPGPLPT